jgi:hypothetical protein
MTKTPKFDLSPVPTEELIDALIKREGVTYHATAFVNEPWKIIRGTSDYCAQSGQGRVRILVVL